MNIVEKANALIALSKPGCDCPACEQMVQAARNHGPEIAAALKVAVEALESIKNRPMQVCGGFEVCNHVGCNSSYTAFAMADRALRELGIEVGDE